MKKEFGEGQLRGLFLRAGDSLQNPVTAYLFGGGAMCFRGQKFATKDLDLLFETRRDFSEFAAALGRLGFEKEASPRGAYERMEAAGIWQEKAGLRLDLFVDRVCGALKFSEGMRTRSEEMGRFGKLAVNTMSNEDVLLLKGITERPRDVADMAAIIRASRVDWNAVLGECIAQSDERHWYGALCNKLAQLKETQGIRAPIRAALLKLDREVLLKEKYESLRKEGMSREEAVLHLRKEYGFTRKELEKMNG